MTGIASSHHVLRIKHLLGELGDSEGPVLLGSTAGQRSESRHEEVKTREWDHVDGKLTKIGIKLTREPKAGGDSTHGGRNEMVEVSIGGSGELQCAETDVIECFVVNAVGLVGVFY